MNKFYMDPKLPDTKKWSVYVPKERVYKKLKELALHSEENINAMVTEGLEIYINIFPDIRNLRREAKSRNLPLEVFIKQLIEERQNR